MQDDKFTGQDDDLTILLNFLPDMTLQSTLSYANLPIPVSFVKDLKNSNIVSEIHYQIYYRGIQYHYDYDYYYYMIL